MGHKIRIKEIIVEIEYLLTITLISSSISNDVMKFLDKYYICLLFVIFHELSHVLIGSLLNKRLSKIFIGISGMTAFFKYDFSKKDNLYYIKQTFIYLAGPMSNLIIAGIFKNIRFVYEINLFLAILNLLPIYPLDGFNILKSILSLLFVNNKRVINKIVRYISVIFLLVIAILCITIFFYYNNVFSVVFLLYVLFLNIQNK